MQFIDIEKYTLYGARHVYNLLIAPKSETEDDRRRELILNITLSSIIFLSLLLDISVLCSEVTERLNYEGVDFFNFSLIILFLVFLLVASRIGYYKNASYGLLSICLGLSCTLPTIGELIYLLQCWDMVLS